MILDISYFKRPKMALHQNYAEVTEMAERCLSPRKARDYAFWLYRAGQAYSLSDGSKYVRTNERAARRLIWC